MHGCVRVEKFRPINLTTVGAFHSRPNASHWIDILADCFSFLTFFEKKMNYFQQRVQPKKCHPSTTWIQLSSFDGQSTVLNGSSWDFFFFSLFVSILIFTALFFFLLVFIICSRRKCYITHEFGRWKKTAWLCCFYLSFEWWLGVELGEVEKRRMGKIMFQRHEATLYNAVTSPAASASASANTRAAKCNRSVWIVPININEIWCAM